MDARKLIPTLTLAATLLGCQSAIPNELADARAAYRHAAEGPASEYDPSALHKAYKSLELAEMTYNVEGDTPATRDRAYVAVRQAQLATVKARAERTQQELDKLDSQTDRAQAKALEQAHDRISETESDLAAERKARQRAEELAKQAREDLAEFATVKQDRRGTVITLTGEVLFQLGKSELLGPARARLSMVAQSLNTSYPDAPIKVVGHTDNQGSDELNRRLSEKRAQSVADFLAQQGVASDRIEAVGQGESEPVASNETPEGRANNRRVEIVVGSGGEQTTFDTSSGDSSGESSSSESAQPTGGTNSPQ